MNDDSDFDDYFKSMDAAAGASRALRQFMREHELDGRSALHRHSLEIKRKDFQFGDESKRFKN